MPAAATRSGVSLIVIALVAGDGRHAPQVDHDPQQVHRFLQVGVAEEERADDLFLVLAALGRRVGHDGDGALRGDAVEVAGGRRHRLQRRFERAVAQVDRDRLVAEGRIEHDVDVGEARRAR